MSNNSKQTSVNREYKQSLYTKTKQYMNSTAYLPSTYWQINKYKRQKKKKNFLGIYPLFSSDCWQGPSKFP